MYTYNRYSTETGLDTIEILRVWKWFDVLRNYCSSPNPTGRLMNVVFCSRDCSKRKYGRCSRRERSTACGCSIIVPRVKGTSTSLTTNYDHLLYSSKVSYLSSCVYHTNFPITSFLCPISAINALSQQLNLPGCFATIHGFVLT